MNNLLDEIKQHVPITYLCSRAGIEVQRNGFIKSIYRDERTPSLRIYNDTSFYDYGNSEHGSVIDFYMGLYGVDLKTAIKELAGIAGLDTANNIERTPVQPPAKPKTENETFFDAMTELEKELYEERLSISGSGSVALRDVKLKRLEDNKDVFNEFYYYCTKQGWNKKAYDYLTVERKLSPLQVEGFKLFFIENYNQVNNHLKKYFNYDIDKLRRSGLYNDKGNLIFYNHRIIFPYQWNYEIIYLRGRYFVQDNNSNTDRYKYIGLRNDGLKLNTPKRFFNIDTIKRMLPDEHLYIVEGEFDAIALESMGFNSVAVPGVGNLPKAEKFRMLKDYTIYVCVDNDVAGEKLKTEIAKVLIPQQKAFYIKELPVKDVNQFLIENSS